MYGYMIYKCQRYKKILISVITYIIQAKIIVEHNILYEIGAKYVETKYYDLYRYEYFIYFKIFKIVNYLL